jgi:hypothetical protein
MLIAITRRDEISLVAKKSDLLATEESVFMADAERRVQNMIKFGAYIYQCVGLVPRSWLTFCMTCGSFRCEPSGNERTLQVKAGITFTATTTITTNGGRTMPMLAERCLFSLD